MSTCRLAESALLRCIGRCASKTNAGALGPSPSRRATSSLVSSGRPSSSHTALNRAIAIHGVNHLEVEHNVFFDTRGPGF